MLCAIRWTGSSGQCSSRNALSWPALGDAPQGGEPGHEDAVAGGLHRGRQVGPVAGQFPRANLEIVESEYAVNEDDRGV